MQEMLLKQLLTQNKITYLQMTLAIKNLDKILLVNQMHLKVTNELRVYNNQFRIRVQMFL